jgi:hypothetical protein
MEEPTYIAPREDGKSTLLEKLQRENFWDASLKERKEKFENANKQLNSYLTNQGIPEMNIRYYCSYDSIVHSVLFGYDDCKINCWILDNIFKNYIDKALQNIYFSEQGSEPIRQNESKIDINRLFNFSVFTKIGADTNRVFGYEFYKDQFSKEELEDIKKKTEDSYDIFSYAIDPHQIFFLPFYFEFLDNLVELRLKISDEKFNNFNIRQGTVVNIAFDYDWHKVLLPKEIVLDSGSIFTPSNMKMRNIEKGSQIKYFINHDDGYNWEICEATILEYKQSSK